MPAAMHTRPTHGLNLSPILAAFQRIPRKLERAKRTFRQKVSLRPSTDGGVRALSLFLSLSLCVCVCFVVVAYPSLLDTSEGARART